MPGRPFPHLQSNSMDRELLFWTVALVMVLAACSAVSLAFLRPHRFTTSNVDADELNRTLLNEQLQSMRKELDAGLISQAIYEASVEDIKRRALEELAHSEKTNVQVHNPLPVMLASCAVVAVAAFSLYACLGSPSLIVFADSVQRHGIMQQDGSLAQSEPQYDARTLRAYLAVNAKDERAWTLYARLLVQDRDWAGAAQAYRAAIDLSGKVSKDPDVILEYAASLMSLQTDATYQEAYDVIKTALKLDETNLHAHELAAIACLELSQWSDARKHLEVLLQRMTFDTSSYRNVAETAAYAAQREREEVQQVEKKESNGR